MMKKKEKKKMSWPQRIILLACLAVFLFSLIKLGGIGFEYVQSEQVMKEIQEQYKGNLQESKAVASENPVRPQFQNLLDINPSIVGWLTIDDTKIDYPILQSSDNNHYLNRNYKEDISKSGSIFMDFRNQAESLNRQTIIYGHQMKDGSMFGQLDKFLDEDFFSQHKEFEFDTIYDSYQVEVFSVYVTTTDFNYIETDFSNDEEYMDFLGVIKEKSKIQTDIQVTEKDNIITLSTCNDLQDPEDGRLVLHGKLTKTN
ncbi:class B sortase [Terribacillus saccharophilus]|uniref:SrtB family sortase n=1 Tax=Terribacillus saccharophilus TaxID=361277 RepID=A0A268ADR3_9BACI|nr:class B sortase [Terribacillus saccharophilus]PAD22261.1 SrtB family sortase [Terribacillus saccharophilus]